MNTSERIATKSERQQKSREEDKKLIADALNGDQASYARLQQKYSPAITALMRKMLRDSLEIEDLVQETFVKAFKALHTFNHDYAFSTWLYKIGSNHCIDFLRKKRLKTFSIDRPIETKDGELQYEIADTQWMPDADMQQADKLRLLKKAVESLPEKYKVVIKLRHEEEMDYQDIADELDLPLGTVKAHLFRARALLYKKLKSKIIHFKDQ